MIRNNYGRVTRPGLLLDDQDRQWFHHAPGDPGRRFRLSAFPGQDGKTMENDKPRARFRRKTFSKGNTLKIDIQRVIVCGLIFKTVFFFFYPYKYLCFSSFQRAIFIIQYICYIQIVTYRYRLFFSVSWPPRPDSGTLWRTGISLCPPVSNRSIAAATVGSSRGT